MNIWFVFWGHFSLLLHFELIGRLSLSLSDWCKWDTSAAPLCVRRALLRRRRKRRGERKRRRRRRDRREKPSKAAETRTDAGTEWKSRFVYLPSRACGWWCGWWRRIRLIRIFEEKGGVGEAGVGGGREGGGGGAGCFVLNLKTTQAVVFSKIWRSPRTRSPKSGFYHERNRHGSAVEDPRSSQLRLLQRFIVVKVSSDRSACISPDIDP